MVSPVLDWLPNLPWMDDQIAFLNSLRGVVPDSVKICPLNRGFLFFLAQYLLYHSELTNIHSRGLWMNLSGKKLQIVRVFSGFKET